MTGISFSFIGATSYGSITSAMGMYVSCFIMNVTFSALDVTFSALGVTFSTMGVTISTMGVTFSAMDNQCGLIANLPERGYKDFDSFSHFHLW